MLNNLDICNFHYNVFRSQIEAQITDDVISQVGDQVLGEICDNIAANNIRTSNILLDNWPD